MQTAQIHFSSSRLEKDTEIFLETVPNGMSLSHKTSTIHKEWFETARHVKAHADRVQNNFVYNVLRS
jgi:hypothetical protein